MDIKLLEMNGRQEYDIISDDHIVDMKYFLELEQFPFAVIKLIK